MANEIMLIQTLADLGQATAGMLSTAQSFRGIRKRDAVIFEEKLRYLRALLWAKGYEELFRTSLEQLQNTYQDIVKNKYTGEMLRIALRMLSFQEECLRRNIEAYARG